jgi:hypothetical protein
MATPQMIPHPTPARRPTARILSVGMEVTCRGSSTTYAVLAGESLIMELSR